MPLVFNAPIANERSLAMAVLTQLIVFAALTLAGISAAAEEAPVPMKPRDAQSGTLLFKSRSTGESFAAVNPHGPLRYVVRARM
jgi:hypothetical protein